jgi:subtilisin family serine protease
MTMRPIRTRSFIAAFAVLATAFMFSPPIAAAAPTGEVRSAGPDAIAGSYIVVLKPAAVSASATETTVSSLTARFGGQVSAVWQSALRGFALRAGAETAARIAADPRVAYVQQDVAIRLDAVQAPTPSWGLDRIDQRSQPLSNSYTFNTAAPNVNAYIIDSGIRTTHADFGGRAIFAVNTTGDGANTDCFGHGTHVAGTVGGAAFGVAKGVRLFAVKVFDCFGNGSAATVISGVNWVAQNAVRPAVANMSLSGAAFQPLDDAVQGAINAGVTVAVASGNNTADACGFSPARLPAALTANASNVSDRRSGFSNFGGCTDLFAPGENIISDWFTSDTAAAALSGTSMASPHVAGAAALILSASPAATPAQVHAAIIANATPNVIVDAGPGSPNRLLFTVTGNPPPGVATLFRFFNGADHITAPSTPPGYGIEGPLGRMLTNQIPGTHPIFQCRIGGDFFTSTTANCEGQVVIGLTGFLYDTPPFQPNTPLRRCHITGNGEHFDSITANCEGQTVEGIIGYLI